MNCRMSPKLCSVRIGMVRPARGERSQAGITEEGANVPEGRWRHVYSANPRTKSPARSHAVAAIHMRRATSPKCTPASVMPASSALGLM